VNRDGTLREAKEPAAEAADAIRAPLQSNSDQGPIQSLRSRACTFCFAANTRCLDQCELYGSEIESSSYRFWPV
jgi:hypothetical protein